MYVIVQEEWLAYSPAFETANEKRKKEITIWNNQIIYHCYFKKDEVKIKKYVRVFYYL